MQNAKELRRPIYDLVEGFLDRKMTGTEHDQLKSAMQSYVDGQEARIKDAFATIQRQGRKVRALGVAYYNLQKNKGIAEADLEFLQEIFKTDSPSTESPL